jgi:cysteine desulfurase
VNGNKDTRLPNTSNMSFANLSAQKLLDSCTGIAASAGSACTSGGDDPNYALKACGYSEEKAMCAIRFSFGRFSTVQHAMTRLILSLVPSTIPVNDLRQV